MTRNVVIVVVVALLAAAPLSGRAVAQPVLFQSDIGMMVFSVRTDRAAIFEDVLARLAQALGNPREAASPPPAAALKMFRSTLKPAEGWVQYVVLVERPQAGADYSLGQLIHRMLPEAATHLIEQLTSATDGVPPVLQDLALVHSVAPSDAVRSRLDAFLRDQLMSSERTPAGGRSDAEAAGTLERLREPLWTVDDLDVRVVAKDSAGWEFEWTFSLRNVSVRDIAADIVLEFRDNAGVLIETALIFQSVLPQQSRSVSGRLRIPAASAARVAATSVRVDTR